VQDQLTIAGRPIGRGHPCFIIAEAGVNHDGDLARARQLIDVAVEARADAIKFQSFHADRLASIHAPLAAYQRAHDPALTQREMLRRLELSDADHRALFDHCRQRGILFLSSPFDEASADLLERLGVAAYKIPSGEITNLPLLRHLASKQKPLVVSTGMADLGEVEQAANALRAAGNTTLALLHCVSRYPAPAADANLRAMETLRAAFGCPVGFSDHTLGTEVALAAVALGACLIEKHFTLDRDRSGPDHAISLEPRGLIELVRGIRRVEQALGHGRKEPVPGEAEVAAVARKSLIAARDVAAGCPLQAGDILVQRPGTGIAPSWAERITGRRLRLPLREGDLIRWDHFEG
jgi:N-acetylneuraminate synthase